MQTEPEFDSATLGRDILAAIPDALIFADVQGVIRLWNAGAEAVFGYVAADAIGRSLDLIIPEPLRKPHWDGFHRAIRQGATVHAGRSTVTRALHKNGHKIYVDMSFSVVRNDKGETIGSAAVARDVTERTLQDKKLCQQLAGLNAGSTD